MKKISFIMAVMAVLVSCQKNEGGVPPVAEDAPIAFGVESFGSSVSTKAYSENTATQVQANGFNVAALNGSTLLFNEKATYASSKYSPVNGPYYYPASGKVDFYAVYPVSQSVSVSGSAATLVYTQNIDTDLLAAKKTQVEKSANSVPIVFDHVLSLLKFKAVGTDAKALYKVKSIKVTVPSSGTYTYSTGAWTNISTTSQYAYSTTVTQIASSGETATEIAGAITVIPSTPTIAVEWDTYSLDGTTLIQSYSDSKPLGEAVSIGKTSTITLKLPNDDAQGITFAVTVNPWQPESHTLEF